MNLDHILDRIKDARAEVLLVAETHRMPEKVRDQLHQADEHLQKAILLLSETDLTDEPKSGGPPYGPTSTRPV
jgi:hypothetical protein